MTSDSLWTTAFRWLLLKHQLERVLEMATDPDREDRQLKLQCVECYYEGRVAGQAFTAWKCRDCGAKDLWGNTDVPVLCAECASTTECCTQCGKTREMDAGMQDTMRRIIHHFAEKIS